MFPKKSSGGNCDSIRPEPTASFPRPTIAVNFASTSRNRLRDFTSKQVIMQKKPTLIKP
jgi:hypothetical protein